MMDRGLAVLSERGRELGDKDKSGVDKTCRDNGRLLCSSDRRSLWTWTTQLLLEWRFPSFEWNYFLEVLGSFPCSERISLCQTIYMRLYLPLTIARTCARVWWNPIPLESFQHGQSGPALHCKRKREPISQLFTFSFKKCADPLSLIMAYCLIVDECKANEMSFVYDYIFI